MAVARVLYDSSVVYAALESDGRLRIRRGGSVGQTVCNVSAERIAFADTRADDHDGAWLALHGATDRVDFARREPCVGLVGPFPAQEAVALAAALRNGLSLPRIAARVTPEALRDEPERWHERWIEVEGHWSLGKDVSDFAGAWLYPPASAKLGEGSWHVRVVGFFRCTGSRDFDDKRDGHGPLGLLPAEFDAFEIRQLT